ncbi:MAG TPA: hypothetical protein PLD95_03105 [bacterium]|jgi:DNA-directed RNA polymerase subunit RPC12/RpoP|nr:hypothetical protein [bacterium]HOG38436.1 hypothetical protein [bacterium]HQI03302.1 hypothetical protein [bacterium]
MEQYIESEQAKQLSYAEPQDEYVCIRCGNKVELVIDGICLRCSNELDTQEQK